MSRWTVTYTKHIKQKRKVYQDGILELSGGKVLLYDDCEKLIDSRFLKKDEVVDCGGMLTFDTHLVDIEDPEVSIGPSVDQNVGIEDEKLKESSGAHRQMPFYLGKKKSTMQSLPSKNDSNPPHGNINGNKNITVQNEAAQKQSDPIPSNNREWNALYTTQITQKSKRFHDGIVRLVSCGSHMNQVILLNEDGTVLTSKYLKSVECVETGRDYGFSNYLVHICERRTIPGDNSHGDSLQEAAGCIRSRMDNLNQKDTGRKPMPHEDIQKEHAGRVDCGDPDGCRFANTNSKLIHEWDALYTVQKTQKAKKYHDGILQLVNCGSHMKQVILLNEEGAELSSKHLKSVECVKTGQKCEFPNYLVEICVQRTPARGDTSNLPLEEVADSRSTSIDRVTNTENNYNDKSFLEDIRKGHVEEVRGGVGSDSGRSAGLNSRPTHDDIRKGDAEEVRGSVHSNSGRSTGLNTRPIRDATQILSSLKRPDHTPQSSDNISLDVENKNKMPEFNARKSTEDNHTANTIVAYSNCPGKPPSQKHFTSSNRLSRLSFGPVDSTNMDKIASPSNSPVEDHINADKNRGLTDEIMALQLEWTDLSYRVTTIRNTNTPMRPMQEDTHADERCEMDPPQDVSSPLCVATEARSMEPELHSSSNTCLDEDEFPTFDLGFE